MGRSIHLCCCKNRCFTGLYYGFDPKKRLTTSEAIDDVKKTKENKNLFKEKISFLGDQNFNFLKKKQIIILGAF